MNVVAIIPALNEEHAIGKVVAEIPRDLIDEVIVVDNGSTDATAVVASAAGARVVSQPERGYGAASMAGVEAAPDADVYVFMDGDHSDVPTRLAELIEPIRRDEVDVVFGVRAGIVERGAMLWHQRAGNMFMTWLIRRASGRPVHDLPSLKALRRSTLLSFDLRERTHGWPAELVTSAALSGARILEIETGYRRRIGTSKVSGSVRGSALAAYRANAAIVKVWLKYRRRRQPLSRD